MNLLPLETFQLFVFLVSVLLLNSLFLKCVGQIAIARMFLLFTKGAAYGISGWYGLIRVARSCSLLGFRTYTALL